MGLRAEIGNALATALFGHKATEKLDRPSGIAGTPGIGFDTYLLGRFSQEQLQRLAMRSAWFFSNITLLARKCSKPALSVLEVKGEGAEAVYDHPFERLMRRPNPLMGGKYLLQYTLAWLGLDGNAYWYLTTDANRELAELWPLPARSVTPVPGPGGVGGEVLARYDWYTGERTVPIPADKICHFRLVNPFNILSGLGLIDALRFELQGDLAQARWQLAFFDKKRAIPEAVASVPIETTDEDLDRARLEAEREFGAGKRRMMWVRAGQVKIEMMGLSQEQMQFLATREFTRETVDRVCGLPAGYWDKSATRANAEAAELALTRDTVAPTLDGIAGEIDAQILDRFYGESLTAEFEDVVPQNRQLKVREFDSYSKVMTVDEARGERNLKPIGGEIGGTLVSLVPALAQMMAGGFGGGFASLPASAMPQKLAAARNGSQHKAGPVEIDGDADAIRDELRTWMKVAGREAKKGNAPAEREFVSDVIPPFVLGAIAEGLKGAGTPEAVEAVFRPWLAEGAAEVWRGYP